jgi:hypothetical protein
MFHAYQINLIITANDTAGFNTRAISTKTMTFKG